MSKTKIEWATDTWNPITGCNPVSAGCQNCYAARMAKRLAGRCGYPADEPFKVTRHVGQLMKPLHWRKPRTVFVCSMGDLFHENVEDWMLDEIFGMMLACWALDDLPSHRFLVLTKRPERMHKYFTERTPAELLREWARIAPVHLREDTLEAIVCSLCSSDWDENWHLRSGSEYKPWGYTSRIWPLRNVWLGVTAENQETADERIPILLQTPAAKRFVSCEPLLGSVNIRRYLMDGIDPGLCTNCGEGHGFTRCPNYGGVSNTHKRRDGSLCADFRRKNFAIDWIIAGGETGPGARPMHPDWVRGLRDQCQSAGVPFFFKSWGDWAPLIDQPWEQRPRGNCRIVNHAGFEGYHGSGAMWTRRTGKKKAGRLLDGREWNEVPDNGQGC